MSNSENTRDTCDHEWVNTGSSGDYPIGMKDRWKCPRCGAVIYTCSPTTNAEQEFINGYRREGATE